MVEVFSDIRSEVASDYIKACHCMSKTKRRSKSLVKNDIGLPENTQIFGKSKLVSIL